MPPNGRYFFISSSIYMIQDISHTGCFCFKLGYFFLNAMKATHAVCAGELYDLGDIV